MWWPFGKKRKFIPLGLLPAEDTWSVAQGENSGKPMVVRINSSAKDYAGHPELPVRFGIAVPLHTPNEHGLPSEAESEQLRDIEDRIFDTINTTGRVILIISTGGMREFVSYVGSIELAEQIATQVRDTTTTHEVQHYAEPDSKWAVYRKFA